MMEISCYFSEQFSIYRIFYSQVGSINRRIFPFAFVRVEFSAKDREATARLHQMESQPPDFTSRIIIYTFRN